jgi:repressor LexA
MEVLTRRQREIFNFIRDNYESFSYPPSLDQLCAALGMVSRGSLYKHIMALIEWSWWNLLLARKRAVFA